LVLGRVLPSHLYFCLGGSFFFVSAQTYITLTILAILAHLSFQLLYEPVVNCYVHVANLQSECNRTDNFNTVLKPWNQGGKVTLKSFNTSLKSIDPLLFSVAKHLLPAGAVVDHMGVNATSVHKPETECDFFVKIVNAL
jgi:hypothetical protein